MDHPEKHILRMTTPEGFLEKFHEMLPDYSTQEQAYEAAERLYERNFGRRKYANFESFKASKNRSQRTGKKGGQQ